VTTDETGSIDEQVASSATEATEIDGTNVSAPAESPAGAENTDTAPQEHMIPKSRLDQELGKKRDLEAQLAEAEAKLKSMEPKETEPAQTEPEEPPPGLSQHEALRWYVERYSDNMIQKKLGMSLEDAAQAISASKTTGQDYATRRWEAECGKRSIDPQSEEAAKMVSGLVGAKTHTLEEAFALAQQLYGKPKEAAPSTPTASVETTGISPVMAREGRLPQSKEEATDMASKGQRAKRLSSQEIIDMRNEAMKKAASGSHTRRID